MHIANRDNKFSLKSLIWVDAIVGYLLWEHDFVLIRYTQQR